MRPLRLLRTASLLLCAVHCLAAFGQSNSQWLLVTAPAFRAELAPLIEQRRAEGFKVVVMETINVLTREQIERGDAAPLLARLKQLCQAETGTNYILLAGAFPVPGFTNADVVIPTLVGTIGRMEGRPTDYGYGFPDKDGAPTVAVGRFPARTVPEIRRLVGKTLALEQDRAPGAWRNRLVLLTGDTGGGTMADLMIEPVVASRLERLHPSWNLRAIAMSGASRFYLPAEQARAMAVEQLQAGELFSVYMGHSSAYGMWLAGTNYLTAKDWWELNIPRGQGIFFTCGCFACQFHGDGGPGYALVAIRNPRGPAAVIGASGESYAAPGQLALDGLLQCLNQPPFPSRLADYWLAVQTGLAKGTMDDITFNLYDQFDGTKGKEPLAVQRREHLEMWMLLGDPALRLPVVPVDIALQVTKPVRPGESVTVTGILPARLAGATVHVSLERPLTSAPSQENLPDHAPGSASNGERAMIANYERANDFVLTAAEARSDQIKFTCVLPVPLKLSGTNLVIRAYATNQSESALGVITWPVRP